MRTLMFSLSVYAVVGLGYAGVAKILVPATNVYGAMYVAAMWPAFLCSGLGFGCDPIPDNPRFMFTFTEDNSN